jgi:phosphate transport system substrate-binding protein
MGGIARAAAALLLLNLFAGGAATAETLRVGGTGGAIDLLRQVGTGFTAASGIRLDIAMSLGTNGSLRALADGVLDIAVSGRLLTAEESAAGFAVVPLARTALVFATSHRSPNGLRRADLPGIFASARPTWTDGSALKIVLRTRLDADTMILGDAIAGMREAFAIARQRLDVPVAATDQDNTKLGETIPGSLIFTGLSQIDMERRDLRTVAIDGVTPSLATFESGAYPLEKSFYLVFPAKRSAAAQRFLDFARSPDGRRSLRASGNLPIEE